MIINSLLDDSLVSVRLSILDIMGKTLEFLYVIYIYLSK
jgi:hypothetical protein